MGVKKAVALAREYKKPLFGVHHMEAHALMPLMTHSRRLEFPFAALLLSGGHTLLAIVNSVTSFHVIASTLDDALGEALDKVHRLITAGWTPPKNESVNIRFLFCDVAAAHALIFHAFPCDLVQSDTSWASIGDVSRRDKRNGCFFVPFATAWEAGLRL